MFKHYQHTSIDVVHFSGSFNASAKFKFIKRRHLFFQDYTYTMIYGDLHSSEDTFFTYNSIKIIGYWYSMF